VDLKGETIVSYFILIVSILFFLWFGVKEILALKVEFKAGVKKNILVMIADVFFPLISMVFGFILLTVLIFKIFNISSIDINLTK
jgi:hypothetical protein